MPHIKLNQVILGTRDCECGMRQQLCFFFRDGGDANCEVTSSVSK